MPPNPGGAAAAAAEDGATAAAAEDGATDPAAILSLSRGEVRHALGTAKFRRQRHTFGLVLWSDKFLARQVAKKAALEKSLANPAIRRARAPLQRELDALTLAIATQQHTRALNTNGREIASLLSAGEARISAAQTAALRAALAQGPPAGADVVDLDIEADIEADAGAAAAAAMDAGAAATDAGAAADAPLPSPVQHLMDAFERSLTMFTAAWAIFCHPGRRAIQAEAKRRKKRLMAVVINKVVEFGSDVPLRTTHASATSPRPFPVLHIGDWVLQKRKRPGPFAMKEFITALSKKAVVIICSEHNTTQR